MEYSFVTPSTPQAPPAGPSHAQAPSPKASTISARLKQRRVSLPSTQLLRSHSHSQLFRDEMALDGEHSVKPEPRDEPATSARTTPSSSASPVEVKPVKKQRKKWTTEETQMLVDGCNEWGVGNWKAILNDPRFVFQNRSPVDLKDRFRTYFPDAYRLHYPNAKTHLSSRVRSTLPDGTSIFEKTRSKKRRPFSKEEDEALRRGYEQHGTVWATIVKDPVFQSRRSTDLRDRFRNAFPDLYQQAGYKPRPARKTQKPRTNGMYTDEPSPPAAVIPKADADARPRAADTKSKPGRGLRIVTKPTTKKRGSGSRGRGRKIDDDSEDDEDEDDDVDVDDDLESEDDVAAAAAATTPSSAGNARRGSMRLRQHVHASRATPQPSHPNGYIDASALSVHSHSPQTESEDVDMSDSPIVPADIELPATPSAANFPRELTPISPKVVDVSQPQSQDSIEPPTAATDDVSSVLSSHGFDSLIYPAGGDADSTWLTGTSVTSPTSSEYFLHPHHTHKTAQQDETMDRIGKSAWATSDWLSGNPRLDNALSGALAFGGWGGNSVVDRYNLYTSSAGAAAHEFASEVGQSAGDHRIDHYNDFGDASIFREGNPISYYAGDLFPGSGVVNPTVHATMQMQMQMQVEDMSGVGVGSASQSVVDEQGVECLSLESVVQPHMLQAGLGRLSLAEAAGEMSDAVSMEKNAPTESNSLHISIPPNANMRDETNTPTIPYMHPMPSSLSNLSMAGIEALSTSPKRPSTHRSHSLFDLSCMDALDLQRPGYPVSFDGQMDATAAALDLAAFGLHLGPSGAESVSAKPHQAHHHGHQRMHSQSAISPSDLMIRKTSDADDKMRKRTSWRM
ncbi:Myb-like DNA-binding domain protein [Ceratobasidium sp. AG-Ba]|nr:Myb-like DNA-binding domain protein [Ceratobasidium sp. AG-Ba]